MDGARCYTLYGLTIESALPLPSPSVQRKTPADVFLRPGTTARFARARAELARSASGADDRFCCERLGDGSRYLQWPRLFEFIVSADGRTVLYRALDDASRESFHTYLLGPVLSFRLLAMGVDPLHGTATRIGDRAIVFLGPPGRGKSTLAAALRARGCPVLTDDLVVVAQASGCWNVRAGLRRLKLFAPVAAAVLGHGHPGADSDTGHKCVLSFEGEPREPDLVPLEALYVLPDPERPSASAPPGIGMDPLPRKAAFLEIIGAAFNLAVVDRERLARQFAFARQLSAAVPIRRLRYRRELSELPAVCDALMSQVERSGSSNGAAPVLRTATA